MFYDQRLCGLGKTADAFTHINQSSSRSIYVAPSIELADNSRNPAQHHYIAKDYALIHSDNTDNCVKRFAKLARLSSTHGICTTHATLLNAMMAGTASGLHDFDLVIDELMPLYQAHSVRLEVESYALICQFVDFLPSANGFVKLTIKETQIDRLRTIIESETDEFWMADVPKILALHLLSACHETYITPDNHAVLLSIHTDKKPRQLSAASIITPAAFAQFRSVKILSALFDQTVAYRLLALFGHRLLDVTPTSIDRVHTAKNVKLHYVAPRQYCGSIRDTVCADGQTIGRKIAVHQGQMLANTPYLYNANVCLRDEFGGNGRLVDTPYGHNSYTGFHAAAWCMTQLPSGGQLNTLRDFGVPMATIYAEKNYLPCYQHIMRTALRLSSDSLVTIHVPDHNTASFLQQHIPNAILVQHEIADVYSALGDKVDKKEKVGTNPRAIKSRFEKKYFAGKIDLTSKHQSKITAIKNYIHVMRTHYPAKPELFDFDQFLSQHS
ncbi:hypothetical protein HOP61_13365 [Halomonas daqingensis]|uniref:Uncharacterized protein n=1 Tax=Billgrantia desiderata TaxID=52021 RepID=A0AAW4YV65_9GAMM|nr:hypothetical protein [Halomonas desiderata]MCE8052294.1 hypothetical protein [Halomonas desiderata]